MQCCELKQFLKSCKESRRALNVLNVLMEKLWSRYPGQRWFHLQHPAPVDYKIKRQIWYNYPIICANSDECQLKPISEFIFSKWVSFLSYFWQYQIFRRRFIKKSVFGWGGTRRFSAVPVKQKLWTQINLGKFPIKTKPKPFETVPMSFPKYFEQMSSFELQSTSAFQI